MNPRMFIWISFAKTFSVYEPDIEHDKLNTGYLTHSAQETMIMEFSKYGLRSDHTKKENYFFWTQFWMKTQY